MRFRAYVILVMIQAYTDMTKVESMGQSAGTKSSLAIQKGKNADFMYCSSLLNNSEQHY